jgi:hypothetical protein
MEKLISLRCLLFDLKRNAVTPESGNDRIVYSKNQAQLSLAPGSPAPSGKDLSPGLSALVSLA